VQTVRRTRSHLWPSAEDKTRAAAAAMLAETLSGARTLCGPRAKRNAVTCRNAPGT